MATADDVLKELRRFAKVVLGRFEKVDGRFDKMDNRFDRLELDNKHNWQRQEDFNERIEKKVDMLDRSVQALDERVRYQKDMPERLEQVENDTYDLKRRVAKVEEKVGS